MTVAYNSLSARDLQSKTSVNNGETRESGFWGVLLGTGVQHLRSAALALRTVHKEVEIVHEGPVSRKTVKKGKNGQRVVSLSHLRAIATSVSETDFGDHTGIPETLEHR